MSAVIKIAAPSVSAPDSGLNRVFSDSILSAADSFCNSEILSLLEERGELPDISNKNRLFLFPVDPWQIFSFWTIKKSDIGMIAKKKQRKYRRLNLILRFFDITGIVFDGSNANSQFDIQIDPAAGTCYVPLRRAGRRFIADLGFNNEYGIFYPVCRSNIAETPPGPLDDGITDHQPSGISGAGLSEKTDRVFMPGISSHPSASDK
jgi:uncharacterized protein